MRCQPEANVPVLATLAKEYAVCDNWFSSVPGETWPNRNYAHAGTSDGEDNIKKRLFDNDTIFDRLNEAGRRWRVYHDGIAQLWVFPHLWTDLALRGRFHSIIPRTVRALFAPDDHRRGGSRTRHDEQVPAVLDEDCIASTCR